MRDFTSERTPRPNKILGRFIPNKPNEPQLGKLRVRMSDGSTVELTANRKERRAEIRRLRLEEKKASQQQRNKADTKREDPRAG